MKVLIQRSTKSSVTVNNQVVGSIGEGLTLFADTSHGRRPEFFKAMSPDEATKMFDTFYEMCKEDIRINNVQKGIFGADMKVNVYNDGPVSIMVEIGDAS